MSARTIAFANLALIAVYFIVCAIVWPSLPERIPLHFGASGRADAWTGTSLPAWFGLPLLSFGIAGMMHVLAIFAVRYPSLWNVPEKATFLALPPDVRAPIEDRLVGILAKTSLLTTLLFAAIQVGIYETAMGRVDGLPWFSQVIAGGTVVAMLLITIRESRSIRRRIVQSAEEYGNSSPGAARGAR